MASLQAARRILSLRHLRGVPFLNQSAKALSSSIPRPIEDKTPLVKIPLSEPLPSLPKATYIQHTGKVPETQITTLSNGIRVASEHKFGQFCTVGVCIESGSRFEVAYPSGVSHFLEKLAFGSTQKFKDREDILLRLEKFGGICDCQSTRDTFLYAASVDSRGLDAAVEIIADVVLRPQMTDAEIDMARYAVKFELEDAELRPDQEPFMVEAIHAAAYANNTLGLPKMCPEGNVDAAINRAVLMNFLKSYHTPDRIVLAGVGVDHNKLVEAAQKYFVDEKPIWHDEGSKSKSVHFDKSVAQYTGGIITKEKDMSAVSLGPTPMPELAHLTIGLESVSHQHPDFIAFCVLNMLMGGGGSFSAGGPGKGMYTRLYTHVLNRHHWMYSATAFNHAYADSGIFCINASGHPGQLADLAGIIIHELAVLTGDIGDEELERAKTQLKSMLLMNLESRPVIFEDLARQVLAQGIRQKPEHYIARINKIGKDDINRIAKKMLTSKPSVAAIGSLKSLPRYKDIELGLLHKDGVMPRKKQFSVFR